MADPTGVLDRTAIPDTGTIPNTRGVVIGFIGITNPTIIESRLAIDDAGAVLRTCDQAGCAANADAAIIDKRCSTGNAVAITRCNAGAATDASSTTIDDCLSPEFAVAIRRTGTSPSRTAYTTTAIIDIGIPTLDEVAVAWRHTSCAADTRAAGVTIRVPVENAAAVGAAT